MINYYGHMEKLTVLRTNGLDLASVMFLYFPELDETELKSLISAICTKSEVSSWHN